MFSGAAVATTMGKGFLAIRKAGHLCVETKTQEYTDYSGRDKLMEVRVDVLKPGTEILTNQHFLNRLKFITNRHTRNFHSLVSNFGLMEKSKDLAS